MIITADESIIDEIEKSNNATLFKQIVLDSEADNNESSDQQVGVHTIIIQKMNLLWLYTDQGATITSEE